MSARPDLVIDPSTRRIGWDHEHQRVRDKLWNIRGENVVFSNDEPAMICDNIEVLGQLHSHLHVQEVDMLHQSCVQDQVLVSNWLTSMKATDLTHL